MSETSARRPDPVAEITQAILAEVAADATLSACRSFSELHDVTDANCLGGLCDDDHWIWHPPYTDAEGQQTQEAVDILNAARSAADDHLKGDA